MTRRDPSMMTDEELRKARDLGFATYVSAYVRLMGRALGVTDDSEFDPGTKQAMDAMALAMVEPLNLATEATWRAMMQDHDGMVDTVKRFLIELKQLP